MKKTLLLLSSVALLGTVNAQDVYKQAAGDKNLEVQFAPLGGTPISMGGIRFRSFSSETAAIRLNIFIGGTSETKITAQDSTSTTVGVPSQKETYDKKSSMMLSLRPGYEKHFAGTDKLSPYMGAEAAFNLKTSKEINQSQAAYTVGAAVATENTVYNKTTKGKDGYLSFGANLVAGADWYFAKKAYLGAELGFGFEYKIKSVIKVTDEDAKAAHDNAVANGATLPAYNDPADAKQGKSVGFGPTVNGLIRLGFLF